MSPVSGGCLQPRRAFLIVRGGGQRPLPPDSTYSTAMAGSEGALRLWPHVGSVSSKGGRDEGGRLTAEDQALLQTAIAFCQQQLSVPADPVSLPLQAMSSLGRWWATSSIWE
ncbi:hypothetical protein Celaphus_00009633 [Cervus elaphus hippelaphus]|uniref:Uncharacterized protein n=1 Tax=Cervus elaphus hippelaphus TaxID=46360 RepID=A0A212BZI0_CEREH|nr:hypothetical protein Celaphus_00009633 [Cervus elaphus hippelaphus]